MTVQLSDPYLRPRPHENERLEATQAKDVVTDDHEPEQM